MKNLELIGEKGNSSISSHHSEINLPESLAMTKTFDVVIVGGGIFGCYAAMWLAKQGKRVALIEKEKALFTKASIVNQARLHGGYHYPRSVATAVMSDENKQRFTDEHREFINFSFEKYYAIDRYGSFTDARQFERFCDFIDIKCEKVENHPLFNFTHLDALYLTEEYSFDPILIANHYRSGVLSFDNIQVFTSHQIQNADKSGKDWVIRLTDLETGLSKKMEAPAVINATYCASNAINRLFGFGSIPLMHEISEMVFIHSPQFKDKGLTVMDGPFASMMPYGKSGLLSLSSVAYTHHKVSYDDLPSFECQQQNLNCRPEFTSNCNDCAAKPVSAKNKMMAQIRQYLSEQVELNYFSSFYTIKSKLKANAIDDGRPTEIAVLGKSPDFYCLFAGKINSIYEIEKAMPLQ